MRVAVVDVCVCVCVWNPPLSLVGMHLAIPAASLFVLEQPHIPLTRACLQVLVSGAPGVVSWEQKPAWSQPGRVQGPGPPRAVPAGRCPGLQQGAQLPDVLECACACIFRLYVLRGPCVCECAHRDPAWMYAWMRVLRKGVVVARAKSQGRKPTYGGPRLCLCVSLSLPHAFAGVSENPRPSSKLSPSCTTSSPCSWTSQLYARLHSASFHARNRAALSHARSHDHILTALTSITSTRNPPW
jgi:hypothetical protein